MKLNQFVLWSLLGVAIALLVTQTAARLYKPAEYTLPDYWTKSRKAPVARPETNRPDPSAMPELASAKP